MRARRPGRRALAAIAAALCATTTVMAQTAKPRAKESASSRLKALAGKMADTAATSAAALGADTLLGDRAAQVAGLVGGASPCATSDARAAVPSMPTAGGMLVSAAKKRLFGGKSKDAPVAARDSARAADCPPANAAGQASALKAAGGVALAASPPGMIVTGAAAAAPHAGKAVRALNGRLARRSDSKENMQRDLANGRLELAAITFDPGSDTPAQGFETSLTRLAEALQAADGRFALYVTPEPGDDRPARLALAARRAGIVAMHLQLAGIDAARLVAAGPDVDRTPPDAQPGAARVVIVRLRDR